MARILGNRDDRLRVTTAPTRVGREFVPVATEQAKERRLDDRFVHWAPEGAEQDREAGPAGAPQVPRYVVSEYGASNSGT
jgi:hypothetical protein